MRSDADSNKKPIKAQKASKKADTKTDGKATEALKNSPINYMSDLFIAAMVITWIVNNVYQLIIASAVTISSIMLSFSVGYDCLNTSMWADIGTSVCVPLTAGGAIWMIKNSVQHAIANNRGEQAHMDFPPVPDAEIEYEATSLPDDDSGESEDDE